MSRAPTTEVVANGPCHTRPPRRLSELRDALSWQCLSPHSEACGMLRSPNWPGYPGGTVRYAGTLTSGHFDPHVFDVRTNDPSIIRWIDLLLTPARNTVQYRQGLQDARVDLTYAQSAQSSMAVSHRLTPSQARALRAAAGGADADAHHWSALLRDELVSLTPGARDRIEITAKGRALIAALDQRAPLADTRSARKGFIELVAVARRYGWQTKETDRRDVDGTAVVDIIRGGEHLIAVFRPDPTSGMWRFERAVNVPDKRNIRGIRQLVGLITVVT